MAHLGEPSFPERISVPRGNTHCLEERRDTKSLHGIYGNGSFIQVRFLVLDVVEI